jgi:hypothetical protein
MVKVLALATANVNSWMSQPKSGLITRSPLDVPRIIKIDSLILSSALVVATPPRSSVAGGNFQPRPKKSELMRCLLSDQDRYTPHGDGIGRPTFNNGVPLACSWKIIYQHTATANGNGPAHMGNRTGKQGAGVHVLSNPPGRFIADKYITAPGPRAQLRTMTGHVPHTGGWLRHSIYPPKKLKSTPLIAVVN